MASTRKPYQEPHPRHRPHMSKSKPKSAQSNGAFQSTTSKAQKYDVLSGQVYREIEVHANKRQGSDWIGELQTPALLKNRRPNDNGPRRLFDMAKATVARQMRGINSELLTEIPWRVAEQVWDEIEQIRGESFHAWRTFAAAYPEHFNEAKYRYLVDIKLPGLPLADYFKGLDSTEINWLTCLRLPPRQMSVADVIRVASIKNLAVLDLSDGHVNEASSPALDERVFKSWIELAATEGAFRHLRVLMLGWQEVLSKWIFKHLDSFPSLCCLLVTDSLKMHQKNRSYWEEEAAKYGWVARSAKKSAKSLKPILEDKNFQLGAVSGCYYDAQELFAQLASEKKPSIAARLPVLECWLGGPKRWIHVVEEFPGTRTVWFDNVKINSCGTNYEGGAETETDRDHFKRDREVDSPTKGLLPPPSKRSIAKRRQKGRSAADLLAEFGHVYPGNQTM